MKQKNVEQTLGSKKKKKFVKKIFNKKKKKKKKKSETNKVCLMSIKN